MKSTQLILLSFVIALSFASRVRVAHRQEPPEEWELLGKPDGKAAVRFDVLLKLQNVEKLKTFFEQVSEPGSPLYGQFMEKEEVLKFIRPTQEAFDATTKWLSQYKAHVTEGSDYIRVTTTATEAEKILDTSFLIHHHKEKKTSLVRTHGSVSIPAELAQHVDFVHGASELFTAPLKVSFAQGSQDQPDPAFIITPKTLIELYQVPNINVTNKNNVQGIGAFHDWYSEEALKQFAKAIHMPMPNVKNYGKNCLPDCDEGESDLDVQYMTAMAKGGLTTFAELGVGWFLEFFDVAFNLKTLPKVLSFSYGIPELAQCYVDMPSCKPLGYDESIYIARTDLGFIKLGSAGTSVIVASGDDGALGWELSPVNCPLDPNNICPAGGCTSGTKTKCPSIVIVDEKQGVPCVFPQGNRAVGCKVIAQQSSLSVLLSAFAQTNRQCNVSVDSDMGGQPQFYSNCACGKMKTIKVSDQYVVGPYQYQEELGEMFAPFYPAGSPYVTSVGATQLVPGADKKPAAEEAVASLLAGAGITSGGGFSDYHTQPAYQKAAVESWKKLVKKGDLPAGAFNYSRRAYPDIALNGHQYAIYTNVNENNTSKLVGTVVDGTSASAPAFAGMITLVNEVLLNAGKTQLGFLNPLLYKMSQKHPKAFHDITNGNIKCSRAYCCQYGYSATKGWDPASGLGTPNIAEFINYIKTTK